MDRDGSMVLDLAMQVALTFAAFVVVSVALRSDSRLDATWLTAAATFGMFVTTFYIAFYLWKVSRYLRRLCEMLASDTANSNSGG